MTEVGIDPPVNESDTIFGKILRKEIPATVVYEDDKVLAFKDINPQAPVQKISQLSKAKDEHKELLGHMLLTANEVAKKEGIINSGFRIVINDGKNGAQSVYHLHVHVLGGRQLGWPPG